MLEISLHSRAASDYGSLKRSTETILIKRESSKKKTMSRNI